MKEKIDIFTYFNIISYMTKNSLNKLKRQDTYLEKESPFHITKRIFFSESIRNSSYLNKEKAERKIKYFKWSKDMIRHFSEEKTNKHEHFLTKNLRNKIKSTIRHLFLHIGQAKFKILTTLFASIWRNKYSYIVLW